ncbi:PAS domain S-box protein [Microcoleus sp. A006_D1]|uniref:PAS domain-containing sensor histidine kinase n=1 Tax=Microcoleus sp. A006_D1 TaxID=3055267 RepID=UPI002FD400E6
MPIDINIPSDNLSPTRTGGNPPNLIEEVFRLYDRALAATSNGIVIADATRPDRPIVYCNPAFEQITGYDRSEIIGHNCRFLQGPDTDRTALAQIRVALQEQHDCKVVLKNYRKDGTPFWNELTISPVRDSSGTVTHFIGVQSDITDRKQAEFALKQAEAKYRSIFENATEGIFQTAPDGRYLSANPALARIYGYDSPSELIAKCSAKNLYADRTRGADLSAEISRVGSLKEFESCIFRCDGSTTWISENVREVRNENGELLYYEGSVAEIADRKLAESALLQNEAKWRSLILNSSDIITILDASGRIFYESPSVETVLDYEPEELIGRMVLDFIHPDDRPSVISDLQKLIANPADPIALEARFRRADGSWCFLEGVGINLLADPAVNGIVVNSRDMTARRQAEYRLSKINECFLGFTTDATDNIQRLTALAGELLGGSSAIYSRVDSGLLRAIATWQTPPDYPEVDRAEGHVCTDVCHKGSDRAVVIPNLQNTIYGQIDPAVIRYQLQSYLGQAVRLGDNYVGSVCVLYTESIAPTEADCKLIGIIAGAIGVEEERAASAARDRQKSRELQTALRDLQQTQMQLVQTEKMSSLGQVLAGIAHEINNPVGFVAGNLCHVRGYVLDLLEIVQVYREEYPNPPAKIQKQAEDIDLGFLAEDLPKLLNSMHTGCDRIVEIIQTLRNFSRTDEAKFKPADIHEGLDSTLLMLNSRLKAKAHWQGIEVIKEYGELPKIPCHPGQLNQVFMNILANAMDALEESSIPANKTADSTFPTITIKTETIDNKSIRIRIKDNGPGIPEDNLVRLFDPFFTTKPVGKGTGLGLSISHQIVVEKHNGKLQCISAPGKGTEFIIELPIR